MCCTYGKGVRYDSILVSLLNVDAIFFFSSSLGRVYCFFFVIKILEVGNYYVIYNKWPTRLMQYILYTSHTYSNRPHNMKSIELNHRRSLLSSYTHLNGDFIIDQDLDDFCVMQYENHLALNFPFWTLSKSRFRCLRREHLFIECVAVSCSAMRRKVR